MRVRTVTVEITESEAVSLDLNLESLNVEDVLEHGAVVYDELVEDPDDLAPPYGLLQ